jgi:RimJ/RimL family protein N-acetyltransferase
VPGVTALRRALRPDVVQSERGMRHLLASMPERAEVATWVADDGGIVAWAFAHRRWWSASNTAYAWIGVLPAELGRGLGGALSELAANHVRDLGVDRLYTNVVGDSAGERFARARGFALDHTDVVSTVDPSRVDLSTLKARDARARADGYRLATYAEIDPQALFRLEVETSGDMPGSDAPHELTFDEWTAELLNQPDLAREGSFVVVRGGEAVAHCALCVDWESRRARNEGTGTARSHRGRGLATLAKLATIQWAAERGIRSIITDNAEENAAMLAINRRLGYRPFGTRSRWVRDISATETAS